MRIKEAAAAASLTEKAIRLYEERGLITPTVTEKNGRQFRDYDAETVKRLQTVAALRRAFFSLDQIAQMLDNPDSIPAVFASYRADIEANYSALKPLLDRASSLDTEALPTAEAVSKAMTRPDESDHAETLPSYRFRVWNEEMARDEREAAYLRCQKYMQNWGWQYDAELWISRHIIRHWWKIALAALFILIVCTCPLVIPVNDTVTGYALYYDGEQLLTVSKEAREICQSVAEAEAYDISALPLPETHREHTVTVKGKEYRYLFKRDYFIGTVDIEGFVTWGDQFEYVSDRVGSHYDYVFRQHTGEMIVYLEDFRSHTPGRYVYLHPHFYDNPRSRTGVYFISEENDRQLGYFFSPRGTSIRNPMYADITPDWEPYGQPKTKPFSGSYSQNGLFVFAPDGSIGGADEASQWYWEHIWKHHLIAWFEYLEAGGTRPVQ